MNTLKELIINCKSELLSHSLQNEVLSIHIKNLNRLFDECLLVIESDKNVITTSKNMRVPKFKGKERDNILFFAYCMSKYDYYFINQIAKQSFNQSQAFNFLSENLDVKVTTLRNFRDAFDFHIEQINSNRSGWDKELSPELLAIKNIYDAFSEPMLKEHGIELLEQFEYEPNNEVGNEMDNLAITIDSVIDDLRKEFQVSLEKVQGKKVIYDGHTKDNKSVVIVTPYSKIHARGNGWVDFTLIQIELFKQYSIAISIFRLSDGTCYYVNLEKLFLLLTEDNMMENDREGKHWKLDIWPTKLTIRNGNEFLNLIPNKKEYLEEILN